MKRKILQESRWFALAAVMAVALGSAACERRAWNDHSVAVVDGRYERERDIRRTGYDNGYRDGLQLGRYDSHEHFRYNAHSRVYKDGRDGYQSWMGSFGDYKRAFRDGYERGYGEGYYRRYGWR